jgi:hypothetical protein
MNALEAIIELLFSNIAFVILIGGGLYSFFKRLNETKNTGRTQPEKRVNESPKPKQTVSPFGTTAKNEHEPLKEGHSRESYQRKETKPVIDSKSYSVYGEKARESVRYQDKEDAILDTITVDQKELQNAVIWSEILAKPKALQRR